MGSAIGKDEYATVGYAMDKRGNVDCEAGRRLGCCAYCCRLLVRLDPEEREPGDGVHAVKGFVDKDVVTGRCVHWNEDSGLCRNWANRPRVCREYDCNSDPLLQVVLRQGFTSLAQLVKAEARACIPRENYVTVPYLGQETDHGSGGGTPETPGSRPA